MSTASNDFALVRLGPIPLVVNPVALVVTRDPALRGLPAGDAVAPAGQTDTGLRVGMGLVSALSLGLCTYHGYKRNDSVGWALWWGFWGAVFWPTTVIAFAQGYGRPASEDRESTGRGSHRYGRRYA